MPIVAVQYIDYSGYMDTDYAILALAALAQSTRLETFRRLVAAGDAGIAAGDLARAAEVPQNTMSAHLATLANSGLVRGERQSRSIIYRADLARFRELTRFLLQDCCGGRPEICEPLLDELLPCCPPTREVAET